jgi:[ribosomal protein S18]-alanine N-acetyltransferase
MLGFFKRPTIEVRALRPDHAADCARIHAASFPFAWNQDDFERLLAADNIIADGAFASREGSLAGFALSRQAADEAEILSIAIDPVLRGHGFGQVLLRAHLAQAEARGTHAVFLEVEQGNAVAIALYRRTGFAEVGARPGYYRKAEGRAGAVIMRRSGSM